MKKVLSIVLAAVMAVLMVVPSLAVKTVEPAASAYAQYDRAKIASGDYSELTYDEIASLVMDFIDRKIAEVSEDFDGFEAEVYGQTVEIPLEITGIDTLLQYKDYLSQLGGDFANLDASSLNKTRADGDINLIYSFFEFMAANSDVLGKVFGWTEGNRFDYGKVGEYIEALDESDETNKAIKDFYHDYLLGNDIQTKFVSEIAREMNYTPAQGEDFDTIINNGILNWFSGLCKGILSDAGITELKGYNLKTTDVYTLVKNFCALVLSDNEVKINTYYTYLLDNVVRPALKVAFGYTPTTGESVTNAALVSEFKSVYEDFAKLYEISGGQVYYQAKDGNYYIFTVSATGITSVKAVTWGESLFNFEPPKVEIWDSAKKVGGAYTPVSAEVKDYEPTVYTDAKYAEAMQSDYIKDYVATAESYGVKVTTDEIPEAIKDILKTQGVEMKDKFLLKIDGKILGEEIPDIEISFKEIETEANKAIAQALPTLQTKVDEEVDKAVDAANGVLSDLEAYKAFLPVLGLPTEFTGKVTITSVTVELAYKGYSDADTFVCEVSAKPVYDITYEGNVWDYTQYANQAKDLIGDMSITLPIVGTVKVADVIQDIDFSKGGIEDIVNQVVEKNITNPVATIVVDNLNGSMDGLKDLTSLMNFVNTDFDVDYGVLDFMSNYDSYKGVVGQSNRVLCDTLKMLLSEEGYNSLGIKYDTNDYLTDNLEILCGKANSLISTAKKFVDENKFSELTAGLSDVFTSSHGFNAGMVYNMDFSSLENLFVCAIRLGCDMFVVDNSGILYDIHEIIEDLDTLDSMLVGVSEYALAKVIKEANDNLDGFKYSFTPKTEAELKALDTVKKADPAKDVIMTDLVDLAYYAAEYAVPQVNGIINKLIDTVNGEKGDLPHVSFKLGVEKGETWEKTLTGLTDRALGLLDGLLECAESAQGQADILDKLSVVLSAVIPMNSMLSNYVGLDQAAEYLFHNACAGDFEGFLSYFEVKADPVAGNVPVTKALINASDYIVDAFFPNTVETELYEANTTVQETFTGEISDIAIASRNMKAVNAKKATLLACIFDLLKETNTYLPYFACPNHNTVFVKNVAATCKAKGYDLYKCDACGAEEHRNETALGSHSYGDWTEKQAATCTAEGREERMCSVCFDVQSRKIDPLNHSYGEWTQVKGATCAEDGLRTQKCIRCPDVKSEVIPATGNHVDGDGDNLCDTCGKDLTPKKSFFEKIADFFRSIIDWFKNLFK